MNEDASGFSEYSRVLGTLSASAWAGIPADDHKDFNSFDQWLHGTLNTTVVPMVKKLRDEGDLTVEGIARKVAPSLHSGIERFEAETKRQLDDLNACRGRIERGEQISDGRGGWTTVPPPPEPTAVSEIRAGEIRSFARSLSAEDRSNLIRDAYAAGDDETLRALRSAPLAMRLWPESIDRELAFNRWMTAGWEPVYDAKATVISLRQMLSDRARSLALKIGHIDTTVTFERSARSGQQIMISAADAKDRSKFLATQERADRTGAELVLSE